MVRAIASHFWNWLYRQCHNTSALKLCCALALYKPLENGGAIALPLPLLAILSRCFRGFFRKHQRLEHISGC